MVILDTNVLIDHIRLNRIGGKSILDLLAQKLNINDFSISIISVQELFIGRSMENKNESAYVKDLLSEMNIMPYVFSTAALAGVLMRKSKDMLDFADAAIAATCLENEYELCTLNLKHFTNISSLKVFDLKTL